MKDIFLCYTDLKKKKFRKSQLRGCLSHINIQIKYLLGTSLCGSTMDTKMRKTASVSEVLTVQSWWRRQAAPDNVVAGKRAEIYTGPHKSKRLPVPRWEAPPEVLTWEGGRGAAILKTITPVSSPLRLKDGCQGYLANFINRNPEAGGR